MTTSPRIALVAGVGEGLGGAIARRFARAGYATVLVARGAERLARIAEDIEQAGGQGVAYVADLREETAVSKLFEDVEKELGPISLAVFILIPFYRSVPSEIIDAGRVDGASEIGLYRLTLPLVRPALAAVGVLTMIPIWNDIWWPLILAPSRDSQTLILGTQMFVGQYNTDWNALLSQLTMAMLPVLMVFALFSRQLIRGITAGAVK